MAAAGLEAAWKTRVEREARAEMGGLLRREVAGESGDNGGQGPTVVNSEIGEEVAGCEG